MTTYRVEIDGETVWTGEGDDWKVIPAEYRDRPADTLEDEPHPPAHYLYESVELVERENGEHGPADQLFAVQIAYTDELEQIIAYADPVPADVFAIIAEAVAHPEDESAVKAASIYHGDDIRAVKAAIAAKGQLATRRAEVAAQQRAGVAPVPGVGAPFVKPAAGPQEGN